MPNLFSPIQFVELDRRGVLALLAGAGLATVGTLAGCSPDADASTSSSARSPSSAGAETGAGAAPAGASQASTGAPASSDSANSANSEVGSVASPTSNVAVVYFSVPLTDSENRDADSGASIVMSGDGIFGNVQWTARFVARAAGADLIRIETTTPYPTDDAIFDYALQEQNQNARPEIQLVAADGSAIESLDAYSTVLVGYPIWWYELPMPLYSFFEKYDLAGKNVGLFVVHGGSGMSGTVQDVEGLQPDAQVNENGLSINRRNVADQAEELANEWVAGLGLPGAE